VLYRKYMGQGPEQLFDAAEKEFIDSNAVEDVDPTYGWLPERGRTKSSRSARDIVRTEREYEGRPLKRPVSF